MFQIRTADRRVTLIALIVLFVSLFVFVWANISPSLAQRLWTSTPIPNATPGVFLNMALGQEEDHRQAIANIPDAWKIWIDKDTVAYLLPRDPHGDLSKGWMIVVAHLPTGTVLNYDPAGNEIARREGFYGDQAHAVNVLDQLTKDPQVKAAISELSRRIQQ